MSLDLHPAGHPQGQFQCHLLRFHHRTLEIRLAQCAKPKLLIVNELGYLPLEPAAGHLFFKLISHRYEQGSVLISSKRPVEEWDEVFGDQVVAAAILDRLLHHSHVVTILGDSYRLREKRRSGLSPHRRAAPPRLASAACRRHRRQPRRPEGKQPKKSHRYR
ncbi:ATP-binding protein [Synechococcus sp. BA-132 BA5]|uniref:ATP-binding protein n=1 Tax=Synechococcus sp. BA-132 BA5 TaxID=3110252 RepID=UPI003FCECF78